jgi:hypothetical protein
MTKTHAFLTATGVSLALAVIFVGGNAVAPGQDRLQSSRGRDTERPRSELLAPRGPDTERPRDEEDERPRQRSREDPREP